MPVPQRRRHDKRSLRAVLQRHGERSQPPFTVTACGITQNGSPGSYSYSVLAGNQNFPVDDVTWGDAARFCNWLQNGQPTGAEGPTTTEAGAYTLSGATSTAALMAVTRNGGAEYFIPSENEWYKAAYYDPTLNDGAGGYWTYPTKSNSTPSNALSPAGTNNANYYYYGFANPSTYFTPVGYFEDSPGPYGTYDMGGDVFQWNEADVDGEYRGIRGGSFGDTPDVMAAATRNYYLNYPTANGNSVGFRVASSEVVPEPGSIALLLAGGLGLLAYAWRKRSCAA